MAARVPRSLLMASASASFALSASTLSSPLLSTMLRRCTPSLLTQTSRTLATTRVLRAEAPLNTSASSIFDVATKQTARPSTAAATGNAVVLKDQATPYISKASIIHSSGDMDYSPQKLNLLARQIKGLPVTQALAQMKFAVKKPAPVVARTLHQIMHKATQAEFGDASLPDRGLVVAQAWVGKGIYKHGIIIHGRGRFGRLTRPSAHIKIEVKVANVALAPNRGNRWQGKGGFLPPKRETRRVREVLPETPIYNKWKKLFFDA
ncbi:ribosomal protein L22/L17 [Blastocladiella britannica]|nr:ribosomal protein L22/L17 [Blastocladiella britannica]